MTAPAVFKPCPPTVPPRIWGRLSPAEQDRVLARWRTKFVPRRRPVDEPIPVEDRQPTEPAPRPPRVRKGPPRKGPPPANRVLDWETDMPDRVRGWVDAGLTVEQAAEDVGVKPKYLAEQMREEGYAAELTRLRANSGQRRSMPDSVFVAAARVAAEDGLLLSEAARKLGWERRSFTRRLDRSVEGCAVREMFAANGASRRFTD